MFQVKTGDSRSASFSESLILDDAEEGVVIAGIKDDTLAAKSGLQAGDELVAATIHLDHLNKNEVMNILKVLEPYNDNMKVVTKKDLTAGAGLGSLGFGLNNSKQMLLEEDLSLDLSAGKPNAFLDGLSGNLNAAQGLGGEIKGPTLNGDLPSLSVNKPSADIKTDLGGTLKTPDVSVLSPQVNTPSASLDVDKPEIKTGTLKYKAPGFKMPHFNFPPAKKPKADIDVSGDVDLPSVSGNVETPNVELSGLDLDRPKLDLNGTGRKWHLKKWKGPKIKGPDAHLNADLPAADVNLPQAKTDVDLCTADIDVNLPKADIKSPDLDVQTPELHIDSHKFNWPHKKWKKPKFQGPKADFDMDADVNTPNFNLSAPKIEGDINAPNAKVDLPKADLDVDAPDVNIDPPSGIKNWFNLKFKRNKLHTPKADVDLDANLSTPDVDLSDPKIDGGISTSDIDLNLPTAGVDVKTPNVSTEGPSGKFKFLSLKGSKKSFSGPKVSGTDIHLDSDVSASKIDGEINVEDVNLNLPKAELEGNDVDIEGSTGKFKWLKMPKFGTLKGPKADIDADMKVPDVDLKGPDVRAQDVNLDAGIDAPDLNISTHNVDVKGHDIDVNGPHLNLDPLDVKTKLQKLKLPKIRGSKVKGPELDADVTADLKAPDLSLSPPKIEGGLDTTGLDINLPNADVKGPDVDIEAPEVDASVGKFKPLKIKMPNFGFSGPRVKEPKVDLKLDGGVDPNLPKINVEKHNLELPKADLQPNLSLNTSDLSLSSSKIDGNLPLLNVQTKLPEAELEAPDITGKAVEVADFKGPNAQLKKPELDIDPHLGDFTLPHFKLPELDLSSSEVEVPSPSVEAGVETPRVSIGAATADANTSVPAVDVSSPTLKGDIEGPKVDVKAPDVDINLEKPKSSHFKLPKFNFLGSKIKSSEVNTNANSEEGSGVDSETDTEVEVPAFVFHRLPRNSIDVIGGIADAFDSPKPDTDEKDYVISKGIRLPVVNATSKTGEKIDIMERLKMARDKAPSTNVSPTEEKNDFGLKFAAPSLDVGGSTEAGDSALVRGGTFKVEKPDSVVGLVAPEISTEVSDENDKMSLSLSNMLGLNIKD
uniref:Neuroblast differentiation-associated protein AHNAK-like n=1 Tax=Stegastes partitus TaxID=144197 RepID=A0A3B5AVP2_9TELE